MKKLLITIFLMSGICSAQNVYFSVSTDIKNSVLGSDPTNNKPSFDGIFQFGMIGSVPNHKTVIESTISYEAFNRIRFNRYFFSVGVHLPITENLTVIPSYETSLIGRWGQEWQNVSSHIALLGGNIGVRYKINYHWSVELNTGVLDRVYLNTRYGGRNIRISEQFKVLYRL
jgi:hypothetical protein